MPSGTLSNCSVVAGWGFPRGKRNYALTCTLKQATVYTVLACSCLRVLRIQCITMLDYYVRYRILVPPSPGSAYTWNYSLYRDRGLIGYKGAHVSVVVKEDLDWELCIPIADLNPAPKRGFSITAAKRRRRTKAKEGRKPPQRSARDSLMVGKLRSLLNRRKERRARRLATAVQMLCCSCRCI